MRRIVRYVLHPPSPPNVRGIFGKKLMNLFLIDILKDSKIVALKKGPTTSQSTATVVWYVSLY